LTNFSNRLGASFPVFLVSNWIIQKESRSFTSVTASIHKTRRKEVSVFLRFLLLQLSFNCRRDDKKVATKVSHKLVGVLSTCLIQLNSVVFFRIQRSPLFKAYCNTKTQMRNWSTVDALLTVSPGTEPTLASLGAFGGAVGSTLLAQRPVLYWAVRALIHGGLRHFYISYITAAEREFVLAFISTYSAELAAFAGVCAVRAAAAVASGASAQSEARAYGRCVLTAVDGTAVELGHESADVEGAELRHVAAYAAATRWRRNEREAELTRDRDLLLLPAHTILFAPHVDALLRGFYCNVASMCVLCVESLKPKPLDVLALDDPAVDDSTDPAVASGPMAHRRIHVMTSESDELPLLSSFMLSRPRIAVTRAFDVSPVCVMRPWVVAIAATVVRTRTVALRSLREELVEELVRCQHTTYTCNEPPASAATPVAEVALTVTTPFQRLVQSLLPGGGAGTGAAADEEEPYSPTSPAAEAAPALPTFTRHWMTTAAPSKGATPSVPRGQSVATFSDPASRVDLAGLGAAHARDEETGTLASLNAAAERTTCVPRASDEVRVFAALCRAGEAPVAIDTVPTYQRVAAALGATLQLVPRVDVAPELLPPLPQLVLPLLREETFAALRPGLHGAPAGSAPASLLRCALPGPATDAALSADARVERTFIAASATIAAGATVVDSVVMDGASIGPGVTVRFAIVAPRTRLVAGVEESTSAAGSSSHGDAAAPVVCTGPVERCIILQSGERQAITEGPWAAQGGRPSAGGKQGGAESKKAKIAA
jgi:hypothetical protein